MGRDYQGRRGSAQRGVDRCDRGYRILPAAIGELQTAGDGRICSRAAAQRAGQNPAPETARRRLMRHARAQSGGLEIKFADGCLTAIIRPTERDGRISAAIARELTALAERVEDDDSIAILTITSEGAAFCRGFVEGVDGRAVESIAAIAKPTIALINGDAIDEGLELALACDIRIASSRARFALTQIKRGGIPHCGGTQRLARIAGAGLALKMILTGERIDAATAMRAGILSTVAANRAALDRAGRELQRTIGSRAPIATRLAKEAIRNGVDMTLAQGIRLEEDLYALLQTTADRAEGVR